jgi:hypothetical protein
LRIETLRVAAAAVVFLTGLASRAEAQSGTEWQVRPFFGVTFGGSTTLNDPDQAVGGANLALGVGASLLGNVFGLEGELGHMPGFFQTGDPGLVSSSRVTTLTGNVIVGPPRTATEYSLRPYFVGGVGVMWARAVDAFNAAVNTDMTRPAFDLGGGVSGPLSSRTGLSWDVRYFQSFAGVEDPLGLGAERLSFWRANMALVIRL